METNKPLPDQDLKINPAQSLTQQAATHLEASLDEKKVRELLTGNNPETGENAIAAAINNAKAGNQV